MGLRLKFLVPLNLLIIAIWIVHFAGSMRNLQDTMITAEVEATEQLAFAVKARLESMINRGEAVEPGSAGLGGIADRWPGLDIMVIDPDFRVRLASDPAQIGRRWHEPGIESVLNGTVEIAWNIEGHIHDGRRVIDASVGVTGADGRVRYVIHIAKWLDRLREAIGHQRRAALLLSLFDLAAVAVAVNVLTLLLVIRPLQRIRDFIHATGWIDRHPQQATGDEIGDLQAAVSSLLEQVRTDTDRLRSTLGEREDALQHVAAHRDSLADAVEQVKGELAGAEARLVRVERTAAQAQLSQALAHELRNPLHIIRATAEAAVERCPDVEDLTADITEEVDRINGLITRVLAYTRPSDLHREPVDVRELLETTRSRMCRGRCGMEPSSCAICSVTVGDGAEWIDGDPILLEQAVFNVFSNARDASPESAPIELAAVPDADGGIRITVADRGSGVAEADRDRIFEPFFTRKPQGVGLGLPAVQKIIDLHQGSMTLEDREGGGTVVCLHLPATRSRSHS